MVEILAVRCIIPWKVAKRCSKDLEEMLAAFAEEWSKNFACQKSDGKSRSQKSDEQKDKKVFRDEQKDKKVFRGSYLPRRLIVLQES